MEHKMYDGTGNNCSHRNSNKSFKETFGGRTRKILNRFAIRQLYVERHTYNGKDCGRKLEAWALGIPIGSREVLGRKGLFVTRDIMMMIVMMMVMMVMYTNRISCVIAVNLRIRQGTLSPFVPACISFIFSL